MPVHQTGNFYLPYGIDESNKSFSEGWRFEQHFKTLPEMVSFRMHRIAQLTVLKTGL